MIILFCLRHKDSKRRVQKQVKNKVFKLDSAEPHPIFAKGKSRQKCWNIRIKKERIKKIIRKKRIFAS